MTVDDLNRQRLLLDNDVLRTFVAIAEMLSFSGAARSVSRTPSAVSMQIKKLEEQLGSALFIRAARTIRLTRQGETLLTYARTMLMLSNEAVSRLVDPQLTGVVRLGAPFDISERLFPKILKDLSDAYPGIVVDVVVDTSDRLVNRIDEQRLDLTLTCDVANPSAPRGEVIGTEKLVWAGARQGSAFQQDPLPIATHEDGCIWRAVALEQLERTGQAYRFAYLSPRTTVQCAAVVSDLAVAPLPCSYVTDDMRVLGAEDGFEELGSFDIRLVGKSSATEPVRIIADGIRRLLEEATEASA
ncbi:LysR family transcriptional regulator [Agrobacterium rhizogenes]|uniref:HTH-type transcriptional regulator TtuA n=1 Tax=Rhizobium rhizogenes NBRC 13257 TaxID=1220581 RepID=A0AA87U7W2_RHIRH|nr:LysR substrate-binding domain-containing protein [Rhizobium rhizogenes]NTF65838.1 LysR family transcriptional regulator [Rhizobium rhizogenes]NTF97959.1 LysR family transcriptional regulator [Rhizobium rhizogenes]NTG38981.1 LysR family transcriptional regulator [Rhizobium rhizogenes]NTG58107.1 LysR family transcriptional regulator [Rhizobium rhizogenes]NTG64833.1 LysR family transcriptional regulator [Rhizobium rhizogenes]